MSLPKPLQRWLPLPIASYLIGFFSVATLLFALIGGWMLHQSKEISRLADAGRLQAAQQELAAAARRVEEALQAITTRLSLWEEVYQQLGDPTFYEYWRSNRAMQAGYTPDYVVAVALYDAHGRTLQPGTEGGLPPQRPTQERIIRIEEGRPYLYGFSALRGKGKLDQSSGHLGIKMDFRQALPALNHLVYIEAPSIRYPSQPASFASVDELLAQTRFTAMPIAETAQLEQLMADTLLRYALLSLLLLVLAYLLTSYLLHTPLRNLSAYIDTLRRGNGGHTPSPLSRPLCVSEFELLRNSIVSYQLELEQMNHSLDQKNRELWKLAHHDALTGAPNRRAYEEDWQRLQQLIRGQRLSLSVILIDCDHFKAINDSYGHDVGDRVLQQIATTLRQVLQEGDHHYRLGGDEFAIHLLNTNHKQAEQLATRCLQQLERHDFRELGIREPVRFSIGLATASGEDPGLLGQLHKHADIAMYQAKRAGSNRIVVYNPALAASGEVISSSRFITAVYRAVESGTGIELHFQPVVGLGSDHRGFHEVLVRLRDEQGLIMPGQIFPVIEAEGLAVELDYAIIHRLAQHLAEVGSAAIGRFSINIDGATLMHHDFMERITALKPHLQRVPQGIILEVTETALISELKEAGNRLMQLRQQGYTIALDDFGSGYSSLRYLASMPVDIIKFDINLIRDLEGEASQAGITADMARLIHRVGYQLVAEGIESEALLQQVEALGFTHVQGFLFGRPEAETIAQGRLQYPPSRPSGQEHYTKPDTTH
ncbi:MAG: bifunctional diguanylate cyclase/phosphodiesterase [Gammaproteobacteria bacterium]|nr:bifunctional diguanylate cyclase/phosphodiesterase [Gammaproteobacteria bacterium]